MTKAAPLLAALALGACATALAQSDPSFELEASFADLPAYFPGLLGNGYLSTLTAPRGTEPTRAYLVALQDYTAGDMSRPAAVPGWTEIDFSADPPGPDQGWLNHAPLDAQHFEDYRQRLDLHTGTLSTHYRYLEHGRDTAVDVQTLVSEAAPHLAVSRLTITPHYSGVVHLMFDLVLWAEHAPRFALGKLSGPEIEEALTANGLTQRPEPPARADRADVWYPGFTEVRVAAADPSALTLSVDGRAAEGLPFGMAAAVGLPAGARQVAIGVRRDRYRIALEVSVKVERDKHYAFTKYVAVSRAGWGADAKADLALARSARTRGFESLAAEQRAAWNALWEADILIDGDAKAQQVVHSELYYLLSSSTADTAWAVGPCALTPGYANHVFWDSDTWVFPALLLLHPERARSLVDFRARTLEAARAGAHAHGFAGAMYPWESDPENGTEQVPYSAHVLGDTEIHVNSDVALAQWQYYLATHDRAWLRASGWPVIREVARFWASRATYDARTRHYVLAHVNSVAESHTDIENDTFTNLGAVRALAAASEAARVLGEQPDANWSRIAAGLEVPMSADGRHHLSFDASVPGQSEDFGGGPLVLLFLPALDLEPGPALERGDYDYAVRANRPREVGEVSMGIAPHVIAAAAVGRVQDAATWFETNFTGGTLKPPFNVRTETADNNTGYFLTGSGGYLQSLIYGFTGLRVREAGLIEAYPPVLPAGWRSLTLHDVHVRGERLDITVARDATGAVRLTRRRHQCALCGRTSTGTRS